MLSEDAFEIRAFRPDDEPRIVELLDAAYGGWPYGLAGHSPKELFHRKHLAGPYGQSIMLVAEADGAVVGFEGWVRWKLRAGARTAEAVRGVDLAVHPDYRGRGIHRALVLRANEHFPNSAGFTFGDPNEQARPVSLAVGRREVGPFRLLIRARRPSRVAVRLVSKKFPRRVHETVPQVEAEPVAEALRDGEAVSSLLSEAQESSARLTTAKDVDYLRWRYGLLDSYRAIRAQRGGQLAGLAILRARRSGPLLVSNICELLVARDDRLLARDLLQRAAKAAAVDYVSCHFASRSVQRAAAVLSGFVPARRGPVATVHMLRDDVVPDPTERSSWALCLGDLELL